jgi:hypothetical protein
VIGRELMGFQTLRLNINNSLYSPQRALRPEKNKALDFSRDAQENFLLENVPPGKYTVKLWHEGIPKLQNNSNTAFLTTKPREAGKQVSVSKKQTVTLNFEL